MVEQKAVFSAAGKHSIRFVGSLGYEVVDQDADVTLVPLDDQGLLCPALLHGVDSGDKTLGGGLFVAGGAIDLAGKKQVFDFLGFEGWVELGGWRKVVFDGVSWA